MTKRERVERAINFDKPDRVPYVDSFQNAELIHYYTDGSAQRTWTTGQVLELARQVADMVQGWGLGPSLSTGERSIDRHGITWETDYWYSRIVERPFCRANDYAVVLEKEIKRIRQSSPDYPEAEQKMFLDDDLLLAPVKEFRGIFEQYLGLLGGTVLMYPDISPGLDHLYTLGGWMLFTELLYDSPDVLVEYMEAMTRLHEERAHAIADRDLSPVVLVACDIAHKSGPLMSPAFLKAHFFPRVKRIAEAYHQHGMKVFYHSEGNLWPVLSDLVGTGIDGLNPMEPHCHMEMMDVRKEFHDLVLWGGVDNSYMLVRGSPEDTRKRVLEVVELGKDGGVLIGSTGQVHPACKLENLLALIRTVHGQCG